MTAQSSRSSNQELPLTQFVGDPTQFITPSWDDLTTLSFQVAQELLIKHQPIDRIVTLAKGGWPMTRSLVDFLRVSAVASIGVKFYADINERLKVPQVYQDLPISVQGERVLLFDDVADTGESLQYTKDYLLQAGVAEVVTATLFYKPHSIVRPDVFGTETKAWIIFPYEMVEATMLLRKKWQAQEIADDVIMQRFEQLGFRIEWVQQYL
jgi:uncharacterized protein